MKFADLFTRFTEKRSQSLENPANPWDVLFDAGSRKSVTGLSVTPENSLETTTVWSAVRMLSSTIATLPLPVYRHTTDGKEKAREHPAYTLLHDRPNPEMSSFTWREVTMAHLLLFGNAFAEIERNGAGQPVALWPIHPALVTIRRIADRKVYVVRVDGRDVPLNAENVLHIPGFSLDGQSGLIPVHIARNAIALSRATEDFGSSFFGNGAAPSGVLTHPGKLGAEAAANLKNSWTAQNGGLTNAQRIAVLEEGMTWTPLGIAPEHAQFLETRKFQVSEIARLFLIPPHMLADLERSTFSNIEHQAIQYVQHTIAPWAKRIEQELNYKLFADRSHFAEFQLHGLLRGDTAAQTEHLTAMLGAGVYSVNEARDYLNMNRIAEGDTHRVPLNMAPLGAEPEAPNDAV